MLEVMAYELQAIIGRELELRRFAAGLNHAALVRLNEEFRMLPLTDSLLSEIDALDPRPEELRGTEEHRLSPRITRRAAESSAQGALAYLGAEFFGGVGEQWAVVCREGKVVDGPLSALDAINRALRVLGVRRAEGSDEFDTVGLGRHRRTDDWVPEE